MGQRGPWTPRGSDSHRLNVPKPPATKLNIDDEALEWVRGLVIQLRLSVLGEQLRFSRPVSHRIGNVNFFFVWAIVFPREVET
jgi:hypothetical protein